MKDLSLFFVPTALASTMSCTNLPMPTATPPPLTPKFTLSPTRTSTRTSSPIPSLTATLTQVPPTFTPILEIATVKLSEAELAESYQAWLEEVGLSVKTVEVKLADKELKVSMKKVGIPVYMVEEFEMLGTHTVLQVPDVVIDTGSIISKGLRLTS